MSAARTKSVANDLEEGGAVISSSSSSGGGNTVLASPDDGGGNAAGTAGFCSAFLNTIKSIVGSGILVMPYSFMKTGVDNSVVMLLAIGVWSFYLQCLIGECARRTKAKSFDGMMAHVLGRPGRIIGAINVIIHQLLVCCAYLIFVGKNISAISGLDYRIVVGIVTPTFALLCMIRNMKSLGFTSLLGNIALFGSVIVIIVIAAQRIATNGGAATLDPDSALAAGRGSFASLAEMFGMAAFAFAGHAEAVPIYQSMRRKASYTKIVVGSAIVTLPMYIAFAIVAFFAFGDSTSEIIFENLPGVAGDITKVCMSATIYMTLPLKMLPAVDTIQDAIGLREDLGTASSGTAGAALGGRCGQRRCDTTCLRRRCTNRRWWLSNALRATLAVIAAVLAVVVPDFKFVVALVGSFSLGFIAFVAPALVYLRLMAIGDGAAGGSTKGEAESPKQQARPAAASSIELTSTSTRSSAPETILEVKANTATPVVKQRRATRFKIVFAVHVVLFAIGLLAMLGTTTEVVLSKVAGDPHS